MNTSSRVGQYATVFSILSLFNYLLNEKASQYSLLSDHALWRHLHTYVCSLTRLSVLNEDKINTVREIDIVSCVEKLPDEHGLSCWKITKWTRLVFSVIPQVIESMIIKQWELKYIARVFAIDQLKFDQFKHQVKPLIRNNLSLQN